MRASKRNNVLALALAVAVAAAALLGAGCGAGTPDLGGGEAGGYDVTFPEGWEEASPQRFAHVEEQIGAGAEVLLGTEDAPQIELVELWSGSVDGSRVEIDIQTEELPVDGMDLAQYDELANQNATGVPGIKVEGTEPYIPFDDEEASVTDYTFDAPGLTTVRIATTVHDGYAYNVELSAKDAASREAASPVLDGVIESWSWED